MDLNTMAASDLPMKFAVFHTARRLTVNFIRSLVQYDDIEINIR